MLEQTISKSSIGEKFHCYLIFHCKFFLHLKRMKKVETLKKKFCKICSLFFLFIFFFPIYREFDNCPRNNKCNSFYLLNPKSPTPEITINTCENCGNCSILLLVRLRVSGYRYLKFWQLLWDRWRRLLSIERKFWCSVFINKSTFPRDCLPVKLSQPTWLSHLSYLS